MLKEIIQRAWPEWKVEGKIGRGGFGTVFKVDKTGGISMPSAVKVISVPGDEFEIDSLEAEGYSDEQSSTYFREYLSGVKKEIEIMAKLKYSNNIVKIEDYKIVEKADGFGWYILVRMELLTPLTALTKQGTLSEEEVIKLGMDICSALELCEKEGIIHRDIKPGNIFVDQNGNYKLGDFGIARELGTKSVKSIAGAEQYIAPEIMVGKYDGRVDIYSLGLVLYTLLNNNNLPFLDDATKVIPAMREEAIKRRLEGEESFPTPMNASEEMADLLAWACLYDKTGIWKSEEKEISYTEKRIERASRFKKELSDVSSGNYVLRGDRTVKIPRPQEPKPEPKKKNKVIIGLCILLLLVGVGIAFGAIFSKNNDEGAGNETTPTPKATNGPTVTSDTEGHKHVYIEEIVKNVTCGTEGEIKYFCQGCGDTYTDVIPVRGEHSYESETDENCDVCGAERKVGHDFEAEITKQATCGEAGEKVYTCSECGESYTEELYATGKHSYKNACDDSCDVCGKIRKVNHTYGSEITKKATCDEAGERTYTCSVCGDAYKEVISATGKHSYKNACDESCNVCGNIRKVSHTYEEEITKKATCGEAGKKTYTCSVCGDLYTETISATGNHSYSNACDGYCDVCGTVRQASHSYVSQITKQATCGETGQQKYICYVCGDSYSTAISATGNHSYENACDDFCDVCGTIRTVEHKWKAATCTTAKTCTVCDTTEGSANGHKFSSSTDITCDVCNTVCGYLEKGEWSAWQDEEIVSSDNSIEVDKKPEVFVGYNQKTMYKYSRYCRKDNLRAWPSWTAYCTELESTGWLDYRLEEQAIGENSFKSYGRGAVNGKDLYWYNEEYQTVDDLNSPIYKTQYRYREVYAVYY